MVKGFVVRGSPTGLINLLTVLERNAKQLRHVNNDACMLHYEALHCYKILIRVKLRDVLGTTGSSAALP
jgi:acyl CoA:acetate/3-ketoacid CoA transferase alpha subunit